MKKRLSPRVSVIVSGIQKDFSFLTLVTIWRRGHFMHAFLFSCDREWDREKCVRREMHSNLRVRNDWKMKRLRQGFTAQDARQRGHEQGKGKTTTTANELPGPALRFILLRLSLFTFFSEFKLFRLPLSSSLFPNGE